MDGNMTLSVPDVVEGLNSTITNRTLTHNDSMDTYTDVLTFTTQVDLILGRVTVGVLALLGIVGNILAIIVWHMETSFSATVFLFKHLAVWDILYLLSVFIYSFIIRHPVLASSPSQEVIYRISNFVQLMSVHITLLLTVTRWVAVKFPLHASRLLTPRRIYSSCILLVVYSAILEASQMVYDHYHPDVTDTLLYLTKRAVGLALPFLLLLIFNLNLLWLATRQPPELLQIEMREKRAQRRPILSTCTSVEEEEDTHVEELGMEADEVQSQQEEQPQQQEQRQQQQHERQPQQQQLHQQQNQLQQQPQQQQQQQKQQKQQQREPKSNGRTQTAHGAHHSISQRSRKQQLLTAVLLVSLCSFISYPIGISLQAYGHCCMDTLKPPYYIVVSVTFIFQVVNSGINVLIYWFFVSKFKELAKKLRLRACGRGRVP